MDDFLHNLRSGKLKQQGGGNRPFNDPQYKGGVRRTPMDRRNKGHHDNKESAERLNAIKEVLENLDRTQKKMAEAYAARTRAEERKARAMEILAKNLYKMLNPNADDADQLFAESPAPVQAPAEPAMPAQRKFSTKNRDELNDDTEDEPYSLEPSYAEVEDLDDPAEDDDSSDDDGAMDANDGESDVAGGSKPRGRLTEVDRHTLRAVINQMRESGEGCEKIARHIAAQGYPTISGKGSWRGVMVKSLFEKMEE